MSMPMDAMYIIHITSNETIEFSCDFFVLIFPLLLPVLVLAILHCLESHKGCSSSETPLMCFMAFNAFVFCLHVDMLKVFTEGIVEFPTPETKERRNSSDTIGQNAYKYGHLSWLGYESISILVFLDTLPVTVLTNLANTSRHGSLHPTAPRETSQMG